MTTDPDQIRQEIEATRESLSSDVNTLNEKVNPTYIMARGKGRVRDKVQDAKDKVMGMAPSGSGPSGVMGTAQDKASAAASSVSDAASATPDMVRGRTEGNPLAAGLIAFGVGWLASSLLPTTNAEQQAVTELKDKASELAEPVKEEAKQIAQDMAGQLKEPAQEAAESVKSTAQDAASQVKSEAQSAQATVTEQAKDSKDSVRDQTT